MKKVIGPNGEVRPEDPVEAAIATARILTGETTEEEVKKNVEEEETGED